MSNYSFDGSSDVYLPVDVSISADTEEVHLSEVGISTQVKLKTRRPRIRFNR